QLRCHRSCAHRQRVQKGTRGLGQASHPSRKHVREGRTALVSGGLRRRVTRELLEEERTAASFYRNAVALLVAQPGGAQCADQLTGISLGHRLTAPAAPPPRAL